MVQIDGCVERSDRQRLVLTELQEVAVADFSGRHFDVDR